MQTDPATELYLFCQYLKSQNGKTTGDALVKAFGLESADESAFSKLLSIVSRRFEVLIERIDEIPDLEGSLAVRSKAAVEGIKGALVPSAYHADWQQIRGQTLTPERLASLEHLGPHFKRLYPLKTLSDDERQALIADIDKALEILREQDDGSFIYDTVSSSLESIKVALERLRCLGVEALAEELIAVYGKLSVAQEKAGNEQERSLVQVGWKAVKRVVVGLAMTGAALQGLSTVWDHGQASLEFLESNIPAEVLLLSGPDESDHGDSAGAEDPKDGGSSEPSQSTEDDTPEEPVST